MAKDLEKFIVFSLNQKAYALSIFDTYQIFAYQHLNPVPQTNKFIAGLTYHDGHIVTVLHTAKILGISEKNLPKQAILLREDSHYYAYLVDEVLDVVELGEIKKRKLKILQLKEILTSINLHE